MKIFRDKVFILLFFFPLMSLGVQTRFVTINLLAINDFHGQVTQGRRVLNAPVGGAAILTTYLKQSGLSNPNTLLILAGDQIGASPPVSALLNEIPTIAFLNQLSNSHCTTANKFHPACNLVATIGNHEFDKGLESLLKLLDGKIQTSYSKEIHYKGANFPFVSANIAAKKTHQLIFPPYVIKEVNGIKIAFIGAILKSAPSVIMPSLITHLEFLDEARSINKFIPVIRAKGADIIVVVIHQGGEQASYKGNTKNFSRVNGEIIPIVKRLNSAVDLVISGHTHQFTNAFIKNNQGKSILLTQAYSYSTAFAEITLTYDNQLKKLINKKAKIMTTFANRGAGLSPDKKIQQFVKHAELRVANITNRYITTLKNNLLKNPNRAGEFALGNLIADAIRHQMKSDVAILNPGSIRANLYAGRITWGNVYAVSPFANHLVTLQMTGEDIMQLLQEQWRNQPKPRLLLVSGIRYKWNPKKPISTRVSDVFIQNKPLEMNKLYTVATSSFLAEGGNNFRAFKGAKIVARGPEDLAAIIDYIQLQPNPLTIEMDGRIQVND